MNNYVVFERDEKYADEYIVSRHRTLKTAIAKAMVNYRKSGLTTGVDLRDSSDDLIDELGLVNAETGGEFIMHIRK